MFTPPLSLLVSAADALPAEDRELGQVRWAVWRAYGASAGIVLLVTVIVSLALTQARTLAYVLHTVKQTGCGACMPWHGSSWAFRLCGSISCCSVIQPLRCEQQTRQTS